MSHGRNVSRITKQVPWVLKVTLQGLLRPIFSTSTVEPLLPLQSSECFMIFALVIMLCMAPAHGCVCLLVLEYKESLYVFCRSQNIHYIPSKYYCSRLLNEFSITYQLQLHQMLCILAAEKKICAHWCWL